MLNKSWTIKYQDSDEEDYLTTAETLEEAMQTRIDLIEEGYQNIIIESVRT